MKEVLKKFTGRKFIAMILGVLVGVAAPHSYFFSENVMLTSPSPSSERRVSSSVFCIFPRRVRLYMFSP